MASESPSTFSNAISQLLNSWTALQLAVEHGFGGAESKEKATWMVYAIETWFKENDNIETFEVEDFLEEVCNTEFDLIIEDNSTKEIAALLCLYYRLCQGNKLEELNQRLQSLPKPSVLNCQRQDMDEEDVDIDDETPNVPSTSQASPRVHSSVHQTSSTTESTEDMDMSVPEDQHTVEDGWQVIRKGKKKK
ncbi:pre-rRNA-processing protein TSR2 [Biomphalaria glabrata]|uniref:Pre-rRNA-processing protein TSR2 homolog n=1 Tax=Biomphalaria glabrata TaxID=6526 RepID=A0A9U8DXE4_BIOGL|nr:pre-rRNA-processing protein TSR2 homolog [Biomphalaria glabrata]KAI8733229.1 putative pre-rRNA-processing protein TSR2 [Biomphalaria glabrata]